MRSLQDIADRLDLADLAAAYCRAVDRRDFTLLASLYHPQATHDHGALFSGPATRFVAWLQGAMDGVVTHHFTGNALYHLAGDRAEGEVYSVNYHVMPGDPRRDYVAGGRYLDHYVREGGRWLFASRRRVLDWAHEGPTADAGVAAAVGRGSTGRDDPSWGALPGLATALARDGGRP